MDENDDEKCLMRCDHLTMSISASPAHNYALQPVDQLTPLSRILQGQKVEDICQTESPGMSPAPATPIINYKLKIRELEQKVEMVKKDKHSLENTLICEQQARENLENVNTDLDHRIKINNQKLTRNKKEIDELRQENDKMWALTEERDDLLCKNAVFRQRLTKLTELEEEVSVLQRSVQDLTERNTELEREASTLKSCKADSRQLNAQIAEQQAAIDEFQMTCSMQDQELKRLLDMESKHKQEYGMLKELFDAQKLEINANGTGTPDVSFFQGETMNVVTQIEMQELKEKLDEVQGTWMDPQKFSNLKTKLEYSDKELSAEKERYKNLFSDYEKRLNAINSLEIENFKLHETIAATNDQLTTVQLDFQKISKNTDSVIKQHEEVSSEIELMTHKNTALATENKDLIEQKALLEKFIDNYNIAFKNGISSLNAVLPSAVCRSPFQSPSALKPSAVSINNFQPQLMEAIGNVQSYIESVKLASSKSCKENLELTRHLESLQEEKKNLTLTLENFNLMLNNTKEELENQKNTCNVLQSDLDTLRQEHSTHKSHASTEKEQLKFKLQEHQSEIAAYQSQMQDLQKKVEEHFATIQAMHVSWVTPENANKMKNEINQLKDECRDMENEREGKNSVLCEKITTLSSENDSLLIKIKDMKSEKETVEQRHADECLEVERKLLEVQYSNSQELTSQLQARESEWKESMESLMTQVQELENSDRDKCVQIEQQLKQIEALEDQDKDDNIMIVSLKSENVDLVKHKEVMTDKNAELIVTNTTLATKIEEINRTLKTKDQDLDNLKQEYSVKELELQNDLQDMKSKFNELLQTLQESEIRNSSIPQNEASMEEDGLKHNTQIPSETENILRTTVENLQNQLQEAENRVLQQQTHEEEIIEMNADRIEELKQTITNLENELQVTKISTLEAQNVTETELLRMRTRHEAVQTTLEELKEQNEGARREIASRDHEIEICKLRYSEAEEQLVKSKVDHSLSAEGFKAQIETMRTGKDDLKRKVEALESKTTLYEAQIKKSDANLVQQKVEYESRIITLENKIKQLEFELGESRDLSTTINSCDMNGNGTILTPNKLLRSLSEDCLSTPTNKMMNQNNDSLNDSLEFIKPMPLTNRQQRTVPSLNSTMSLDTPSNSSLSRSCMSVESSLLGPPNNNQQREQPPHAFSTGDLSHDSWQVFASPSHASNFELSSRRMTMGPNNFVHRQAGRPSLLGFSRRTSFENEKALWEEISILQSQRARDKRLPVLEEPNDPNYSCSLKRIAELQDRNSRQPSHLKSSYPIETQGKTPSKCDETIRIGKANETMKRVDEVKESGHSKEKMSIIRSLPGYRSSSSLQAKRDQQRAPSAMHGTKRKQVPTLEPDMRWDITSPKSRRETIAGPFATASSINKFTAKHTNENRRVTRQSMAFEITNTPPVNIGTRRRRPRKSPPAHSTLAASSKPSKKTPEKLLTTRQRAKESGKRTPSLMDRMRKPLGRLNPKK